MADWIAALAYQKVGRELSEDGQHAIVQERTMYMYRDGIATKYRRFRIVEVLDMSYRSIGTEGGLFYLHTTRGVFTYMVAVDPVDFMARFRELKSAE